MIIVKLYKDFEKALIKDEIFNLDCDLFDVLQQNTRYTDSLKDKVHMKLFTNIDDLFYLLFVYLDTHPGLNS